MRPLRVRIGWADDAPLAEPEVRYTVETLLTLVGCPWEIVEPADRAPVDIAYGRTPPEDCRLFIQMAPPDAGRVPRPSRVVREHGHVFLLFHSAQRPADILECGGGRTCIANDLLLSSFFLLTGRHERGAPRTRHGDLDVRALFLYQEDLLLQPLVNRYAELVRACFAESHGALPLWPDGKRYAVALTHDVDYPQMVRWIEAVRYLGRHRTRTRARDVLRLLGGGETFWRFSEWMALEEAADVRSAFYFCGRPGSVAGYLLRAPDPFYDVARGEFRALFADLTRRGFEIGMHGSFRAYQSPHLLAGEKRYVEAAAEQRLEGNRHHYWHMNPANPGETARYQAEAGFRYDASLALEQRAGFRYGICTPLHLYDPDVGRPAETLELPTTLMDDQLFGYAHLSRHPTREGEVDAVLGAVRAAGGLLVVDYHGRVLNEMCFPGWGASYRDLLAHIAHDGAAYCALPRDIATHWLDRETTLRAASSHGA